MIAVLIPALLQAPMAVLCQGATHTAIEIAHPSQHTALKAAPIDAEPSYSRNHISSQSCGDTPVLVGLLTFSPRDSETGRALDLQLSRLKLKPADGVSLAPIAGRVETYLSDRVSRPDSAAQVTRCTVLQL